MKAAAPNEKLTSCIYRFSHLLGMLRCTVANVMMTICFYYHYRSTDQESILQNVWRWQQIQWMYKTTLYPSEFSASILFTICCTVCHTRKECLLFFFHHRLVHSFLLSQTLISFICFACHLFVPLMQTWRFFFLMFLHIHSIAMRSKWTDDQQCWKVQMESVDVNSSKLSAFRVKKGKQILAFYFGVQHVCYYFTLFFMHSMWRPFEKLPFSFPSSSSSLHQHRP